MPDSLDGPSPYLEPLPVPWAMRSLATILVALFVAIVIASAVIQVPETVTSSFVLRPVHGANPVRTPRAGLVARVLVVEGQPVEEANALFVIRSEAVGERSSELRALEAERDGARHALELEREKFASSRRAEQEEIRQLEQRAANLDRTVALRRREAKLTAEVAERFAKLEAQELVSRTDQVKHELEANDAKLAVEQAEAERLETQGALERLRHEIGAREAERRETERELLERTAQAEIRIAPLLADLRERAGSELSIFAPCEGSVLRLQVQSPGSFVQPGEVLGEVACAGDPLQAQLTLPNTDLALLEPGQGVKLLFDAFPYQRHGVRYASLRWISPSSVEVDGQRVFRALADVEDEAIFVRGKPRPLKAGMGGSAKIVVGRRRVISFAFEPLRQLREAMRAIPSDRINPSSTEEERS